MNSSDTINKYRVAHLTSVHRVLDNRILVKQCASLAKTGFDVTLIAVHDKQEIIHGVRIRPVRPPKHRLNRILFTTLRVLVAALRERADLYHFHDPELIPAGLFLRLLGKPVVYDVREDYPKAALNRRYLPRFSRRAIAWAFDKFELAAAKRFSAVTLANPLGMKRFSSVATLVQNFPRREELLIESEVEYLQRGPIIAHIGALSVARGIVELVRAIELLPTNLDIEMVFVGAFESPAIEKMVTALPGWKRVTYLGWRDRALVMQVLGKARAGLVMLHPIPQYVVTQSTKLFEYLGAGIPVISGRYGFNLELTEKTGCGLSIDTRNPREIADAILWILSHPEEARAMGNRGREEVLSSYTWESEALRLTNLYQSLLYPAPFVQAERTSVCP